VPTVNGTLTLAGNTLMEVASGTRGTNYDGINIGDGQSLTVLAPVPHRHLTFTIPEMLRPYFRFHRGLIKELCRIAHRCLAEFLDYRVLTLLGTGLMGQLAAALGEGGEP